MDAPLDTFRPSTKGWLLGTLAGWGTLLLGLAGIVITLLGYGLYFLALTAIALLIILWRWLENMGSKYEITEERLIIRRGIVSKSIDEVELYRVKDIRIDFSLINQLAGIGRITIGSSDETTRSGDLVIAGIDRAQERRETLRRLVDAARQKRRVREIDMHEDV
ncbi:MAG: PH domain-containing protein [Sphingomonadaceae bacterium]|nr:PH domain-containing protein [Sphingomonadaceae bacterium]